MYHTKHTQFRAVLEKKLMYDQSKRVTTQYVVAKKKCFNDQSLIILN